MGEAISKIFTNFVDLWEALFKETPKNEETKTTDTDEKSKIIIKNFIKCFIS